MMVEATVKILPKLENVLSGKDPANKQIVPDPESCVQLQLIAPTMYPLIVASVANLSGRVNLKR